MKIVVGVSVYNEAEHLAETLLAMRGQMIDFRYILLDNGSTDDSWRHLYYERHDVRATVLRADENLRPGRVANLLTHVALTLYPDCQWYLAAGADDVMAPDYLEAILRAADQNPDANLIFSPWAYIGRTDVKHFPPFSPHTCHAEHQIPAWSAMRRDLIEAAGPWDTEMIAADWDWVVRARGLIRPVQLEKPYISLRVRSRSQSHEVHWPTLHQHLCKLANKSVPQWAQGAVKVC